MAINPSALFQYLEINGKPVYVVESHHFVLLPWSLIRRDTGNAPNLVTLDHHTDTRPPFHRAVCGKCYKANEDDSGEFYKAKQGELLQAMDWTNDTSVLEAISHLAHDEHITTAIQTNVINFAICANLSGETTYSLEEKKYYESNVPRFETNEDGNFTFIPPAVEPKPSKPFTYQMPDDRVFHVSSICAVGCDKCPHDEGCDEKHFSQVLDSQYLNFLLDITQQFFDSVGIKLLEEPSYILDIDLDYLHTEAALTPPNLSTFYRLIRGAKSVTIAIERGCFTELLLQGETITPDQALSRLIEHIEAATA